MQIPYEYDQMCVTNLIQMKRLVCLVWKINTMSEHRPQRYMYHIFFKLCRVVYVAYSVTAYLWVELLMIM